MTEDFKSITMGDTMAEYLSTKCFPTNCSDKTTIKLFYKYMSFKT